MADTDSDATRPPRWDGTSDFFEENEPIEKIIA
jgi:hypothetical protein